MRETPDPVQDRAFHRLRVLPLPAGPRNVEPASSVRMARTRATAERSGAGVRSGSAVTAAPTKAPTTYQANAARVPSVLGRRFW